MTNNDVYKIRQGVKACSDLVNVADITFAVTMGRISDQADTQIQIFEKGRKKPSDKYKEYAEKKQKLDLDYTIQKEDGTALVQENATLIKNPKEYFAKKVELDKEYKDELELVEKQNEEFNEFLFKDYNGPAFSRLTKSIIPATLTVEQARLLNTVIDL